MSHERQKKTTDLYRENYDKVFPPKETCGDTQEPCECDDGQCGTSVFSAAREKAGLHPLTRSQLQHKIDQAKENNEHLDRILGCDCG